jgi:AcrR family transcriptional regulator
MLPNSRSGNAADPRVKRTRQLIELAFEELLKERGFQALTVQDIADRATVNRATFYAHFEDKYALLDSFIREGFRQCLSATVPASAALSAANLRRLAGAVFGYFELLHVRQCSTSNKQAIEPLVVTTVQEELYRFVYEWLQPNWRQSDWPQSDWTGSETMATVISWAIFGAGVQWSRGDRKQPVEDVAGQLVEALIAGLSRVVAAPVVERHVSEGNAVALAGRR